ncbi:MAG TPA: VCBS repeat-containing protein, partial [Urbifossiella sp.]|nr:VCBS repeat-containing protein [Urbifossiella sp.]
PAVPGTAFRANVLTAGDQYEPSVGLDAAGNFAIAWTYRVSSSDTDIYFRRFTSTGTYVTATDQVAYNPSGLQSRPNLAMASNGRFVIAFQDSVHTAVRYVEVAPTGIPSAAQYYALFEGNDLAAQVAITAPGNRMIIVADNNRTHPYYPYTRTFQRAPTPADYDGDGKTDAAVFGYGRIAYKPSTGGPDVYIPFGGPADAALAGDYDGDGKTDAAVFGYGRFAYRPSTGGKDVYIPFGGPADVPLPGAVRFGGSQISLAAVKVLVGDSNGVGKAVAAVSVNERIAYRPPSGGASISIPLSRPATAALAGDSDAIRESV